MAAAEPQVVVNRKCPCADRGVFPCVVVELKRVRTDGCIEAASGVRVER